MHKTCGELFSGLPCTIIGDKSVTVDGLAYRSDKVEASYAFFCIVGFKVDGHTFAQDAIDRGASVIVAERNLLLADSSDVVVVIVPDTRKAMAQIASRFYDAPSSSFKLCGVTGTNGKTTTTYLIESISESLGYKCGIVGTTGIRVGDKSIPSEHTTPESPDLERVFAQMRDEGCEVVAMEVSSHALDLQRVYGLDFAVTAFTNLTQDHLDYHNTFDAYFEAKSLLFSEDYPAKRVISIDGKWGQKLATQCSAQGDQILTTGFNGDADIHVASEVEYFSDKTSLVLSICGKDYDVEYPLAGRFNVENVMTAVGVCVQLGFDVDAIVSALKTLNHVPGRLERVQSSSDIDVFVDYAHTPDAVTKALSAVQEISEDACVLIFGCGGDRDASKRPLMGKAALEADFAIITSDNPRTEDPQNIIDDILAGLPNDQCVSLEDAKSILAGDGSASISGKFVVIPDRRSAITFGIENAKPNTSILIAGKGHEDYQIIGEEKIHFDDREVAKEALENRSK